MAARRPAAVLARRTCVATTSPSCSPPRPARLRCGQVDGILGRHRPRTRGLPAQLRVGSTASAARIRSVPSRSAGPLRHRSRVSATVGRARLTCHRPRLLHFASSSVSSVGWGTSPATLARTTPPARRRRHHRRRARSVVHTAAANRFAATVYVGFEPRPTRAPRIAYYTTASFVEPGGRALADRIRGAMEATPTGLPVMTHGVRLPVPAQDDETAVVCSLGPVQRVVDRGARHQRHGGGGTHHVAASPLPESAVVTGASERP